MLSEINPLRYRGYYFDYETGYYYLRSRYYDPQTGRFLSADDVSTISASPFGLTGKNLFAYCDNNPVNMTDHSGRFPWLIAGAAVGGLIGMGFDVLRQRLNGTAWNELDWKSILIAGGAGALSGALGASALNVGWQIAGNALISLAETFVRAAVYDEDVSFSDAGISILSGAIGGFWGGHGLQHGLTRQAYKIVNASAKYFSVKVISYVSSLATRSLGREFAKSVFQTTVFKIITLLPLSDTSSKRKRKPVSPERHLPG